MKPYKDEDRLRELYVEQKLGAPEIANRLGCAKRTVYRWLDNFDIETRTISESAKIRKLREPPHFRTHRGYEEVISSAGEKQDVVRVHRLMMVTEAGYESVVNKQVHHENGVPWDNRPSNLELVSVDEHAEIHNDERERDSRGRYA